MDHKAPDAFRSISEVADELDLPQHVLRFWESRFHDIKPMKRGGGRRYYRPDDVNLLRGIRHLLYGEGYTIRGVQRILREQGAKFVQRRLAGRRAAAAAWRQRRRGYRRGGRRRRPNRSKRIAACAAAVFADRPRPRRSSGRRRGAPRAAAQSAPVPRIEPTDRAIHGAEPAADGTAARGRRFSSASDPGRPAGARRPAQAARRAA